MQGKKEVEHFHKPNNTITLKNGIMTLRQKKSYNILLHKAKQELNKNTSLDIFSISIDELIEKSGDKNKNIKTLELDLKELTNFKIETVKDSLTWNLINLLSEVGREGNIITFSLSPTIRKALAGDEKLVYTTLDLIILKHLTSKYSVILYEVCLRYEKVKIPVYSIDEFRELMGAEKKSYNQYGLLKKKVIDVAVTEINEKTDIKISCEELKKNGSKKVEFLKFKIDNERNYTPKKYKTTKVRQKSFDEIVSKENKNFDEEKHKKGLEEMEKTKEMLKKQGLLRS